MPKCVNYHYLSLNCHYYSCVWWMWFFCKIKLHQPYMKHANLTCQNLYLIEFTYIYEFTWIYYSCLTGRLTAVTFRLVFTACGITLIWYLICITILLIYIYACVNLLNMFIKHEFKLQQFVAISKSYAKRYIIDCLDVFSAFDNSLEKAYDF